MKHNYAIQGKMDNEWTEVLGSDNLNNLVHAIDIMQNNKEKLCDEFQIVDNTANEILFSHEDIEEHGIEELKNQVQVLTEIEEGSN